MTAGERVTAAALIAEDGVRDVDVRFVHLLDTCDGPACTACTDGKLMCGVDLVPRVDLEGRVADANRVFDAAGLRFRVAQVDRYAMPLLHDTTREKDPTWKEIRPELTTLLPALPPDAFPDDAAFPVVIWLAHASALAQPPNQVLVAIAARSTQAWGFYPQEGRVMVQTPGNMSKDTWNFSHEMGHYLGLPHSFGHPWNEHQWDLKAGYLVNPATGKGVRLSDFWDLVYSPGSPPVYYLDRESAREDEAKLKTIDGTDDVFQACQTRVRCCTDGCAVACNLDGVRVAHEDAVLKGSAFATVEGFRVKRGPNVMSYMAGAPTAGCRVGLSESQVLQIRRGLRWDVANTSFPGVAGGRPWLGRSL